MKHLIASLLALLSLTGLPALAERADRDKPMNVESDAMRYEDKQQRGIFTGQVLVTKGSIVMRGARLEVVQDAKGQQTGVLTPEPGQKVYFRQKRDGVDEFIEGEAERLEYDGASDTVRMLRRAELRRLQGSTVNDVVTGNLIVYNSATEVFTVDGTPEPFGRGRVRAVIGPRAATSAPAAKASGATAPLRSSVSLGGGAAR
ncbi:MAG: lipopolysaccharide transport periplasmic protein LptA [Anaerolinea sp.]|nr:lipopolysaccharide transport periplasmic protein LptA [Anaerolinea sp.]